VLAVELDRRAQTLLTAIQAAYPDQLAVAFLDVLQLTAEAIASRLGPGPVAVAGNLPYYLTAPIMGKLVAVDWPWQHAVLMVQREVATRLSANPGERASSALGVLLRYRADIRVIVEKIAPDAFYPPPEIVSSVIQLKRRDALPVPWDAFQWVVHAGFQHRRKMLRQALARGVRSPWDAQTWDRVLEGIAIDPSRRAESLTIPEWVRLASAVGAAPK
jgi:16S rRNA (adenine1518-N6/adenine1519-N6)-dimethyltransferase